MSNNDDPAVAMGIGMGAMFLVVLVVGLFAIFTGRDDDYEPSEQPKAKRAPLDGAAFKEKMAAARAKKRAAQEAATEKINNPAVAT